jgi:transposase
MGQRSVSLAQLLGFDGWVVDEAYFENEHGVRVVATGRYALLRGTRLVLRVRCRWRPRCSGCGAPCDVVHELGTMRRWRDLPWSTHPAFIEYAPRRLKCRVCAAHLVELVAWADPRQTTTRRLQHQLAIECAAAPISQVAARHGLPWSTVRRAEGHAIARWERSLPPSAPLRQVGLDEKYLGRRNKLADKFVTIVSNLETGEPIWIGAGRSKETVRRWLAVLTPEQKKHIDLFAMDMYAAFYIAIDETPGLEHVAITHDPFHVMKRVGEAVDDARRAIFFRSGPDQRAIGRGRRWLLLRAWERNTAQQKADLKWLLAQNGKLARLYQLKEEIRALLRDAVDGDAMMRGLERVWRRTRRSTLNAVRRLGESLEHHVDAIVAFAEWRPPTGRIEALNNNWEAVVRRGRGYRDHEYLRRKLRFMIANPLKTPGGLRAFVDLGQQVPRAA